MRWDQGATRQGSSGAPLLGPAGLAIGVLTGGAPSAPCGGGAEDYFGSLYAAWELGLWRALSPAGPDAAAGRRGRRGTGTFLRPQLRASPTRLELPDDPALAAPLLVFLSASPGAGEALTVDVAVRLHGAPAQPPAAAATTAAAALVFVDPPTLSGFDRLNYGRPRRVLVAPGAAALLQAPLAFELVLTLTSSGGGGGGGGAPATVLDQLVLQGVRSGAQELQGSSVAQAFAVELDDSGRYCHRAALPPAGEAGPRPGSAAANASTSHHFNLTSALSQQLGVAACSNSSSAGLQLAVLGSDGAALAAGSGSSSGSGSAACGAGGGSHLLTCVERAVDWCGELPGSPDPLTVRLTGAAGAGYQLCLGSEPLPTRLAVDV